MSKPNLEFREHIATTHLQGMKDGLQSCSITVRNLDGNLEMVIWNKMNSETCLHLGYKQDGEGDAAILPKGEYDWCRSYFRNLNN